MMYIITHKKFSYPYPKKGYQPILVGAAFNKHVSGYLLDNTGINISDKNKNFCELTGMYWIWKNSHENYVGISHYRRYFSAIPGGVRGTELYTLFAGGAKPIKTAKLDKYLEDYDWIAPEKVPFPGKTVYQQFAEGHHAKDMDATREVIADLHPESLAAFDQVMKEHSYSLYNMCYTTKDKFDDYCQWLFDILFELEKRVDISDYDTYQARLFGFISERLFNVWLLQNKFKVKYIGVYKTDQMDRKYAWHKISHKLKKIVTRK